MPIGHGLNYIVEIFICNESKKERTHENILMRFLLRAQMGPSSQIFCDKEKNSFRDYKIKNNIFKANVFFFSKRISFLIYWLFIIRGRNS